MLKRDLASLASLVPCSARGPLTSHSPLPNLVSPFLSAQLAACSVSKPSHIHSHNGIHAGSDLSSGGALAEGSLAQSKLIGGRSLGNVAGWWQRCLGWRPMETSTVLPLGLPPALCFRLAYIVGLHSWGGMGTRSGQGEAMIQCPEGWR